MAERWNDDEAVLARRAAAGDRDAFAALVERHYDRIFRVGARILGDGDEAADLAQDVCAGLAAKLPSWRGEARSTTWLHSVVVNGARDAWRLQSLSEPLRAPVSLRGTCARGCLRRS